MTCIPFILTVVTLLLCGNILATVAGGDVIDNITGSFVLTIACPHKLSVNGSTLLLGSIIDVHSNLIAKLLANLFQGQLCSLRPEEINGGDEKSTPADD
jgi:hypothetical protein